MEKERVLITGASGFLGSTLVQLLAQSSRYEVIPVAYTRVAGNGGGMQANLLDAEEITALLEQVRPACCVHLAWETRHDVYLHAPENLDWLAASLHLLREFQRCGGKRFVSAGTCNEYAMQYQVLREEETPAGQETLYGQSKRAFYELARIFAQRNALSYACGRIFFLYGERDKGSRAVPYAIQTLLEGKPATCNAANAYRDYMHVQDGAQAFMKLLESSVEGAVNIASGEPTAMGDIFSEIARQLHAEERLTFKRPAQYPGIIAADTTRMRDVLGFAPSISLQEGIARTIQWHRSNQNA